jgi:hypothetical protein
MKSRAAYIYPPTTMLERPENQTICNWHGEKQVRKHVRRFLFGFWPGMATQRFAPKLLEGLRQEVECVHRTCPALVSAL